MEDHKAGPRVEGQISRRMLDPEAEAVARYGTATPDEISRLRFGWIVISLFVVVGLGSYIGATKMIREPSVDEIAVLLEVAASDPTILGRELIGEYREILADANQALVSLVRTFSIASLLAAAAVAGYVFRKRGM